MHVILHNEIRLSNFQIKALQSRFSSVQSRNVKEVVEDNEKTY